MPSRLSRRTVYYLGLVVATTAVFTVAYNVGMAIWEDRLQPLIHTTGQKSMKSIRQAGAANAHNSSVRQYQSFEVVFQSFNENVRRFERELG